MLRWIAGLTFFLISIQASAEFSAPVLPQDSRGVYLFHHPTNVNSFAVGAVDSAAPEANFKLAVGYRRAQMHTAEQGFTPHERATEIVQKLTRQFQKLELSDATVSVDRIYSSTAEVILNVSVSDASQLDFVRRRLISFLQSSPQVLFADTPGQVRADQ